MKDISCTHVMVNIATSYWIQSLYVIYYISTGVKIDLALADGMSHHFGFSSIMGANNREEIKRLVLWFSSASRQ